MILLAAYVSSKDQEQKKELLVENNKNSIDLNTNKPI
jgi:hypothetical protein